MIDTDCLAHRCPGEVDLKQRLRKAGYFDGLHQLPLCREHRLRDDARSRWSQLAGEHVRPHEHAGSRLSGPRRRRFARVQRRALRRQLRHVRRGLRLTRAVASRTSPFGQIAVASSPARRKLRSCLAMALHLHKHSSGPDRDPGRHVAGTRRRPRRRFRLGQRVWLERQREPVEPLQRSRTRRGPLPDQQGARRTPASSPSTTTSACRRPPSATTTGWSAPVASTTSATARAISASAWRASATSAAA